MGRTPKNVRIVEAAGTASATTLSGNKGLGKALEAAMSAEVLKCFKEGVTDPDVIRERKLAIREKVKKEFLDAGNAQRKAPAKE